LFLVPLPLKKAPLVLLERFICFFLRRASFAIKKAVGPRQLYTSALDMSPLLPEYYCHANLTREGLAGRVASIIDQSCKSFVVSSTISASAMSLSFRFASYLSFPEKDEK
jgi:hypothetical protein